MTYRIAVVCLGNICRSPIAEVVLRSKLEAASVEDVEVISAGTGGWHAGGGMDPRAADILTSHGYDATGHVAQQFTIDWYAVSDLLLAMDQSNHADMANLAPSVASVNKLAMFRDFDPEATGADRDVPDPWYGGEAGFMRVLAMVERTSDALIVRLPELMN